MKHPIAWLYNLSKPPERVVLACIPGMNGNAGLREMFKPRGMPRCCRHGMPLTDQLRGGAAGGVAATQNQKPH